MNVHVSSEVGQQAEPLVLRRVRNGVAHLTLNRPGQFNALSEALLLALNAAIRDVGADPEVRCVVLAAAGRAFCAGHDLKEMRTHADEAYFRELFATCSAVMQSIRACPVPVIAAVHGLATAAGCQLVAACDLAVATASTRFAVSGINLGLFCSTPAVALSRAVPAKAAFDMLVTGRFIDAAEALRLNLINAVADESALDATVERYTAEICAKSPDAIRLGKRLFYAQAELPLADAYRLAGETMACNIMQPDARAGIDAFLARRTG